MPKRYRKRQEEVGAVQWTGENAAEVGALTEPDEPRMITSTTPWVDVEAGEGES
jgi:hypothetical protein